MFNYLMFLVLFTLSFIVNAEDLAPTTCEPVVVKDESVVLKAKDPLLVLIHNVSQNDLWITHPVSEPSASAGWSSHLEAGNWSALAVDKESFELSCIESKPGHEQQVPCAGVITICDWTAVKTPEQVKGTFWASENASLATLMSQLVGRGFKLPTAMK